MNEANQLKVAQIHSRISLGEEDQGGPVEQVVGIANKAKSQVNSSDNIGFDDLPKLLVERCRECVRARCPVCRRSLMAYSRFPERRREGRVRSMPWEGGGTGINSVWAGDAGAKISS